jgi:hypothetical protein
MRRPLFELLRADIKSGRRENQNRPEPRLPVLAGFRPQLAAFAFGFPGCFVLPPFMWTGVVYALDPSGGYT